LNKHLFIERNSYNTLFNEIYDYRTRKWCQAGGGGDLGRNGIHVAEYLTELPPREVLKKRLRDAVRLARARLEIRSFPDS
jgi:hypothetical protein